MRRLAAGGGHSAVLTQACSLKELCEVKLAETVTPENCSKIEEIAARNHADTLVRFCEQVRFGLQNPVFFFLFLVNKVLFFKSVFLLILFYARSYALVGGDEYN